MFGKRRSDESHVGTGADILNPDTLCAMSNTELLNEIEKLMAPLPGEDIDTDKVEQYLALLQERAPVMEDYDPVTQWDKLMEEHPLLVEETVAPETLPDTKPSRRPSKRGSGLRILRVAEVAAAVVLCLVVTANAFGVNPIQAFLSWAEGVIQAYSDPSGLMELPADDPSEYHSLEEALTANGIDASGCPTWVPRDYSLCGVWVRATDGIIKCTASYESTRGEIIMRVTQYSMGSTASTEEREDDGYEYTNDNGTYYIVSNYELSKVGWQVGSTSYVISGQVSEEEIVKIINSIIMRSK